MGVEVTAPDGRVWTVRRRWWYSPRWRLADYQFPDGAPMELLLPAFPVAIALFVIAGLVTDLMVWGELDRPDDR